MARRRRADFGTVIEVVRGKKYRIRYWADEGDGYRRHCRTLLCTRREAYDELARLRIEHSSDHRCITVGEAYRAWVLPAEEEAVKLGDMAPHTRAVHESMWKRHVAPAWEDVECSDVSPLAVQRWIDGLSRSVALQSVPTLRRVMSRAVLHETISTNPLDADYRFPSARTSAKRDGGIWKASELLDIWKELHGSRCEASFLLMAFGGCRVGESLAPMSDDVEMLDTPHGTVCTVRIEAQIENSTGRRVERLKNQWSARSVVIPGKAGRRIAEISQLQKGRLLSNDGAGEHLGRRAVSLKIKDAMERAGVEVHPVKNLRSSWETYSHWELGIPQDRIEKLMGHIGSGSIVTASHYDKPMADMLADTVAEAYSRKPFMESAEWALDDEQ